MIVFCCFLPASNKARDDDDHEITEEFTEAVTISVCGEF